MTSADKIVSDIAAYVSPRVYDGTRPVSPAQRIRLQAARKRAQTTSVTRFVFKVGRALGFHKAC